MNKMFASPLPRRPIEHITFYCCKSYKNFAVKFAADRTMAMTKGRYLAISLILHFATLATSLNHIYFCNLTPGIMSISVIVA